MKRREFVARVGALLLVSPLAVRAQRQSVPLIGYLNTATANEYGRLVEGFRQGLQDSGYFEGKNVAIEFRWAEGRYDRLAALATELVNRKVAVIATSGGMAAGGGAKAVTSNVPMVFR